MKTLVVLRGAPGAGKSTWIANNGLEDYTLSIDTIRYMQVAPRMQHEHGYMSTTFKEDTACWKLLFETLEARMANGEFTVVDAVHSKPQEFSRYVNLAKKYRYRMFCVDFSKVPMNLVIERQKVRPEHKRVNELQIQNLYARFAAFKIPNYFKVLNPTDEFESFLKNVPMDVSSYEKLVFLGDLHGCWEPLKEYFQSSPFSDKNFYVFMGDYLDRGIQNKEVCEWLLAHYEKKNVILLTGNHEKWLTAYANEEYRDDVAFLSSSIETQESLRRVQSYSLTCKSEEFIKNVAPQLEQFRKADLRQLTRKFCQCAYLQYGDKKFICTHAGMGFMPKSLQLIATREMTRGGRYTEDVDKWFEVNNTDPNLYQVHGHRNMFEYDIQEFEHSINLNEAIEFGENLRIVEITK